MDSAQNVSATNYLDGFGRTYATYTTDPQSPDGNNRVWTTYDSLGRVQSISNPYFTSSDPTYGLTSFNYDALGRVTKITNPDSTSRTIQYSSRAQLVTDESSIQRAYQFDGLGRLQYVCDGIGAVTQANGAAPSTCAGLDVTKSGFLSTYAYDTLGNLTTATIGACTSCTAQGRSYTYDHLSRLVTEINPEVPTISCGGGSYSVCYAYDTGTAGDLYTKIFSKPSGGTVTATYSWDMLHRPILITFNDGSPNIGYSYDSSSVWGTAVSNPKGRMVLQNHAGVAASIYSYDAMGHIVDAWACTPDICRTSSKHLGYTYNFLGEATTVADAGGAYTFSYSYNRLGELTGISSSPTDATHPGTLFSGGTYNPFGKLIQGTYGDGIVRNNTYDNMGRVTEIQDGSTSSPTYRLYLTYFGNSDVKTYNDTVGGSSSYTYDAFNRLSTSYNASTGNSYSYTYDQFGNRWKQQVTGTGYNSLYTFDNNNHNITTGFSYDSAGNLKSDGSCNPCWVFDDMGNLVTGENATYAYDALGQRVQKTASGITFDLVLGLDGHPFDEYQGSVESRVTGGLFTYANNTTYFNRVDHLGTPRLSTDYTGAPKRTENNLPFGDGFSESYTGLDFTGFANGSWDSENNADHFGAREYAKPQGRWLEPDPAGLAAVDPTNPQTWNRYTYVVNNPLSLVDPSGLLLAAPGECQGGEGLCPWEGGGVDPSSLGGGSVIAVTYGYWPGDGGAWVPTSTEFISFGNGCANFVMSNCGFTPCGLVPYQPCGGGSGKKPTQSQIQQECVDKVNDSGSGKFVNFWSMTSPLIGPDRRGSTIEDLGGTTLKIAVYTFFNTISKTWTPTPFGSLSGVVAGTIETVAKDVVFPVAVGSTGLQLIAHAGCGTVARQSTGQMNPLPPGIISGNP